MDAQVFILGIPLKDVLLAVCVVLIAATIYLLHRKLYILQSNVEYMAGILKDVIVGNTVPHYAAPLTSSSPTPPTASFYVTKPDQSSNQTARPTPDCGVAVHPLATMIQLVNTAAAAAVSQKPPPELEELENEIMQEPEMMIDETNTEDELEEYNITTP